jgi:hypothetical protein
MTTIELTYDQEESITIRSLKENYRLNKEILDSYYHNGAWLHRDDLEDVSLMIHHLKAVIDYYGGSVE